MHAPVSVPFCSVYGPVRSWRYGRSLGIDPIGAVSTCSYDCVYCQLGTIESKTPRRQLFVPTRQILQDLQAFAPWNVDVITLSGSGEPTLALNLGEILSQIKGMTHRLICVLTNGSILFDPIVCSELGFADQVAVKLDAVSAAQFRRVNRPVMGVNLSQTWENLYRFRQQYRGHLAIQTMLLFPWKQDEQDRYIALMQQIAPDEIQLNTPKRPKPESHCLEARGNHPEALYPYPTRRLKGASLESLREFGDRIQAATRIPVRYPVS